MLETFVCSSCFHLRACVRVFVIVCVCVHDLRYLESYAQVPPSALRSNQNPEVALDVADPSLSHIPGLGRSAPTGRPRGEDVETPYKTLYEDRVNPFSDFNRYGRTGVCVRVCTCVPVFMGVCYRACVGRREKLKRYGNLSAAEKITLNSTRLFMANKFARTFVFFYSVGLHLLVFATLYHFTNVKHHA